jgi:NADP-dependent 3-hydroxy acid dehydrogenase YdfG
MKEKLIIITGASSGIGKANSSNFFLIFLKYLLYSSDL